MTKWSDTGYPIDYINTSKDFVHSPFRRMFTTIEYVAPNREVVYKIEDGLYSERLSTFLANKILFSKLKELAQISRGNIYNIKSLRDTNEVCITLAFFGKSPNLRSISIPGTIVHRLEELRI